MGCVSVNLVKFANMFTPGCDCTFCGRVWLTPSERCSPLKPELSKRGIDIMMLGNIPRTTSLRRAGKCIRWLIWDTLLATHEPLSNSGYATTHIVEFNVIEVQVVVLPPHPVGPDHIVSSNQTCQDTKSVPRVAWNLVNIFCGPSLSVRLDRSLTNSNPIL
jgi:hypothetical protein